MTMKIMIVGWYGTETIGDRAILAGIFRFLKISFGNFEVNLGSLYPFFTRRTIDEDYSFWEKTCACPLSVRIFDSKKSEDLHKAIMDSDMVIMGGGPLMHIRAMFMVEYAFKTAKKYGKKTVLAGCGVGPIFYEKFKKSLINISKSSDLILLRDSLSKRYLDNIFHEYGTILEKPIYLGLDPAVQCALNFNQLYREYTNSNIISINLRSFPEEYRKDKKEININKKLCEFIDSLSLLFSKNDILLVPMHYFHIGKDDREFLNQIKFSLNRSNIRVQNSHLSMLETMHVYSQAQYNIGMRFHSVLLQTIVNGKNFVLDYTEPGKGKIAGFLKDIDSSGFYSDRYICLQEDHITSDKISIESLSESFSGNNTFIQDRLRVYTDCLRDIYENKSQ